MADPEAPPEFTSSPKTVMAVADEHTKIKALPVTRVLIDLAALLIAGSNRPG